MTTSMRRGELLGLKWEDLDWIKKTIRVERRTSRTRNKTTTFRPLESRSSRRMIALGDKTIQLLSGHYESEQIERRRAGKRWTENGMMFTN